VNSTFDNLYFSNIIDPMNAKEGLRILAITGIFIAGSVSADSVRSVHRPLKMDPEYNPNLPYNLFTPKGPQGPNTIDLNLMLIPPGFIPIKDKPFVEEV